MTWTSDELNKLASAEELEIASLKRVGTVPPPVTIWVVRNGHDLYIRSVNGRTAAWFRGTQARRVGRIAGGSKNVTFADADAEINDTLDAAYRTKYRRYAGPRARSTTTKVVPR